MKISSLMQYLLPHRLLSHLAHRLAYSKTPWIKHRFIHTILANFDVNLSEAANPDPDSYESFNAFFTRALKPGARIADSDPQTLVLPADGKVSQCGTIEKDRIFQAKGHDYTIAELIGDAEMAKAYENGVFMNIYLSPRDYHRVHMPWTGTLTETLHVPGRLFSVSPGTVNDVPRLFARNERLVCHFDTDFGPMCSVMVGAMLVSGVQTVWNGVNIPEYADKPKHIDFGPMCSVMVGAMLVSGVQTVWNGVNIPDYADKPKHIDFRGQNIRLERFAEMARFNYGSTVILLFPEGKVQLDAFVHQAPTVLGKRMGAVL